MSAPSPYRRAVSRIDRPWIPYAFITEAGNAIRSPIYSHEFREAADESTLIIYRIMFANPAK